MSRKTFYTLLIFFSSYFTLAQSFAQSACDAAFFNDQWEVYKGNSSKWLADIRKSFRARPYRMTRTCFIKLVKFFMDRACVENGVDKGAVNNDLGIAAGTMESLIVSGLEKSQSEIKKLDSLVKVLQGANPTQVANLQNIINNLRDEIKLLSFSVRKVEEKGFISNNNGRAEMVHCVIENRWKDTTQVSYYCEYITGNSRTIETEKNFLSPSYISYNRHDLDDDDRKAIFESGIKKVILYIDFNDGNGYIMAYEYDVEAIEGVPSK